MKPTRRILRIIGLFAAFTVVLVLAVATLIQRSKPALSLWHTVHLTSEFKARDADGGFSWADYLALEARLFEELDERVVIPSRNDADPVWNRYAPGGLNNPAGFPRNWNRSFELTPPGPIGGVLLIHGLTDSPYSMRRTAEILNARGYRVVSLRLPGHGTAPSALNHVEVKDWRAAVRIAYEHLLTTVDGDAPVLVAGYSNGGALALDLTLDTLEDDHLRVPDQLVLYSPAIGITRAAALARAHNVLSWMPWFDKLGWDGIQPEFDAFKYSSFPTDAGYQTHVLTESIRARLAKLDDRAGVFPPVLTFSSLADATVLVEAVYSGLYARLNNPDSELVVFDINRQAMMRDFFKTDPAARLRSLIERPTAPFRLTVIGNIDESTVALEQWTRAAGATEPEITALNLAWPKGIYSLAHVAVPFPPDDPIYGIEPDRVPPFGIPLGTLEPRGEKGILIVSGSDFLRLRSNPFFPYIEQRLVEVTGETTDE
jgi:alpha-beta hydrolase superfamily lysophospholipase